MLPAIIISPSMQFRRVGQLSSIDEYTSQPDAFHFIMLCHFVRRTAFRRTIVWSSAGTSK
jgi:hypothetical protein